MDIGRFRREGKDFVGDLAMPGLHVKEVRLKYLEKGADYAVVNADFGEFGAAWVKNSQFGGDYLSLKIDSPTLPAPINTTMRLSPDENGIFLLRWQLRTNERSRGGEIRRSGGADEAPKTSQTES